MYIYIYYISWDFTNNSAFSFFCLIWKSREFVYTGHQDTKVLYIKYKQNCRNDLNCRNFIILLYDRNTDAVIDISCIVLIKEQRTHLSSGVHNIRTIMREALSFMLWFKPMDICDCTIKPIWSFQKAVNKDFCWPSLSGHFCTVSKSTD